MKEPETRRLQPPTMGQFKEFVRKVIAVPKKDIEKQEKLYQQQRAKKK
jgi:hypothetical protein